MMYIKIWQPTAKWYGLEKAARQSVIERAAYNLSRIERGDFETVGWFKIDGRHNTNFDRGDFFCSVYRASSDSVFDQFQMILHEIKWHEYFEQHQVTMGKMESPGKILEDLIGL